MVERQHCGVSVKRALRILWAIAAVGAIMAIFGALAPARGYVSSDMPDVPGHMEASDVVDGVDCGSMFGPTRWSAYDGCEGIRFNRVGYVAMGIFITVVFGLIGLGLRAFTTHRARDRRRYTSLESVSRSPELRA
jgi:hypothetical protein